MRCRAPHLIHLAITVLWSQKAVATQLCNQGADFIISLQDDTERNAAAEVCNERGVYFAIGGSCQSYIDYDKIKYLPYYVGSVGTSIEEERRSAKEMTEYYLQCMIHREKGDLEEFQIEYKGIVIDEPTAEVVYIPTRKEEEEKWLS